MKNEEEEEEEENILLLIVLHYRYSLILRLPCDFVFTLPFGAFGTISS
jgi:hypothetical protein